MILAVFTNGRQKGVLDIYDLRTDTLPFVNGKAEFWVSLMDSGLGVGAGHQAAFICKIL